MSKISEMIIEELIKKEFNKNFEAPIIEEELERAFAFLMKDE